MLSKVHITEIPSVTEIYDIFRFKQMSLALSQLLKVYLFNYHPDTTRTSSVLKYNSYKLNAFDMIEINSPAVESIFKKLRNDPQGTVWK